jgi:hypothetical protein
VYQEGSVAGIKFDRKGSVAARKFGRKEFLQGIVVGN